MYSEPFLPVALAKSSQVFLARLDKTLGKDVAMAIMKEIKAIAVGPNLFVLDDKEEEGPLTITTVQQDLVNKLSIRGTSTSAKEM